MTAAIGWGALAASSLILGAVLGLARKWPDRFVGLVLAFGAGALISAVSFDLAEEGLQIGDPAFLAAGDGVSLGLLAAIFVSNLPEAIGSATEMRAGGSSPGASGACGSPSRRCAPWRPSWATRSPTRPAATSRGRSTASRPARCS
jgi:ZIP family zinc transporter